MKLLLSCLALAFVASAAPTAVAPVVTRDLPARFAMYIVSDEAPANGLRIRYLNSNLQIDVKGSAASAAVDGVFLGGRGRIALDRAVHKVPNSNGPTNPEQWGDWNLLFLPGVSQLSVAAEEWQATLTSWGPGYVPTVDRFVQDGNNMLRLVTAGVVQPNGIRICRSGAAGYVFWWDDVPYLPCPVAQFRVVPL